jgi:hypothetical protein
MLQFYRIETLSPPRPHEFKHGSLEVADQAGRHNQPWTVRIAAIPLKLE